MKKKYCKKEKELVKRREEDGNGVQEVEERGRENWERRIGEEKGKRERETRRGSRTNGRTLLKFSKKKPFSFPRLSSTEQFSFFLYSYTNNKCIFNYFCYKDHSH